MTTPWPQCGLQFCPPVLATKAIVLWTQNIIDVTRASVVANFDHRLAQSGHGVTQVWSHDASENHSFHAHGDHMVRSLFLSRGHTIMFADARYTSSCEFCQMFWSIMVYSNPGPSDWLRTCAPKSDALIHRATGPYPGGSSAKFAL